MVDYSPKQYYMLQSFDLSSLAVGMLFATFGTLVAFGAFAGLAVVVVAAVLVAYFFIFRFKFLNFFLINQYFLFDS